MFCIKCNKSVLLDSWLSLYRDSAWCACSARWWTGSVVHQGIVGVYTMSKGASDSRSGLLYGGLC